MSSWQTTGYSTSFAVLRPFLGHKMSLMSGRSLKCQVQPLRPVCHLPAEHLGWTQVARTISLGLTKWSGQSGSADLLPLRRGSVWATGLNLYLGFFAHGSCVYQLSNRPLSYLTWLTLGLHILLDPLASWYDSWIPAQLVFWFHTVPSPLALWLGFSGWPLD